MKRHDFGTCFWVTRCSLCKQITYNQGCKEQRLIFCPDCFENKHVPECPPCQASCLLAAENAKENGKKEPAEDVIMEWIPVKRGEQIPKLAIHAGKCEDGAMAYVGRYNGDAGKCIVKEGKLSGICGYRCGKKRLADVLTISAKAVAKWIPVASGEPLPPNAVHTGGTWTDGFLYVGRLKDEVGRIKFDDGKMVGFWGHSKGHQEAVEILTLEWSDATRPVNIVASREPCLPIIIVPGFMSSALSVEESTAMPSWKDVQIWMDKTRLGIKPSYAKGLLEKSLRKLSDEGAEEPDASESSEQLREKWFHHLSLTSDGEEQEGVRLKAIEGLQGIDFPEPGCGFGVLSGAAHVMGPLIETLQEKGYTEGVNLVAASYDWRLAPRTLQSRHDYFERLKTQVETLDREGLGVVLLGHSMGNKTVLYFLSYCERHYGRDWLKKHVYSWIAAGAPHLGTPAAARATLIGDRFGLESFSSMQEAFLLGRSFSSLPWLWPVGDAAKKTFYLRRQGVLEIRGLKVVVPNCGFESVKNDVLVTIEVRWGESHKEVLTTTPAETFDGETASFESIRLQFSGPSALPPDATITVIVKERGFNDDRTKNFFARVAKGAVATIQVLDEATQGRGGFGVPKATTEDITIADMTGIDSKFVDARFPLSATWRMGWQTKAALEDGVLAEDSVFFQAYWRDSDALRPSRAPSDLLDEGVVIERPMFKHRTRQDDVIYDRVQLPQLLTMDECSQSNSMWQDNYVDDDLYNHLGTENCPPIERLLAVHGVNVETEHTYVLCISTCLITATTNMASWFSLDDEAELVDTKTSRVIKKGIVYSNGDGTVPIRSLEHCTAWEDRLELKAERLEGAEHRAMLADKRFHKILLDALIPH